MKLTSPYNLSHPDSICHAPGKRRHKFAEQSRRRIKPGIFETVSACKHCGDTVESMEDNNVLAGIFSIDALAPR